MEKSEQKFNKIKYNNIFNSEKYDRINLMVSKGKKGVIKACAESNGESANAFINRAIDELIKRETEKHN